MKSNRNRTSPHIIAVALSAVLLVGVIGCAPEPGDAAGLTDKETETISPETEWGGLDAVEDEPVTDLPASFPADAFVIPEDAVILNTGERGEGQWFLVLQADSHEEAAVLLDSIVLNSDFEVADEVSTTEGGISTSMTNAVLTVDVLTIPQEDGSEQLSFGLLRWG